METLVMAQKYRYASVMPFRTDDPDKLTASKAWAYLGMKEYKFYSFVRAGLIPRHRDRYYKQHYYLRSELDEFADKFERGEITLPPSQPRKESSPE